METKYSWVLIGVDLVDTGTAIAKDGKVQPVELVDFNASRKEMLKEARNRISLHENLYPSHTDSTNNRMYDCHSKEDKTHWHYCLFGSK